MRDKLINYILKHYKGMNQFRKEYRNITDKMLIEDAEMLLKLYRNDDNTELNNLLTEFQSRR